ncbi:MAG: hypothetical protein EPN30_05365 [Actinomycetota bacterium]|nr:MAG: hypothetical protein EPN30_05365 [Actinomycetota bacterium]
MTKPTFTEIIETGMFTIAGVVAELQESLPKIVAKGRSTLEPKLGMAKFVGQFAVTRFENEFQKRTDSTLDQLTDLVSALFGFSKGQDEHDSSSADHSASDGAASVESAVSGTRTAPKGKASDADDLPISGYRTLSAQQIIARIDSLNQSELDAIVKYESMHRNRASILRSVDAKREKH